MCLILLGQEHCSLYAIHRQVPLYQNKKACILIGKSPGPRQAVVIGQVLAIQGVRYSQVRLYVNQ